MSNDVAMTTGRLSMQPGFGIFRRAAGGTQTVWVFNLLSGRKQAAVSDGIMEKWGLWAWVDGWGVCEELGVWGVGGGHNKVRHHLKLCLKAYTGEMEKLVGGLFCSVLFFFFVTLLIQPWPTTETWEGQTNRLTQIHTETHNQNTFTFPFQNHNQPEMFRLPTIRDTHTHQWTCWQSLLKHTACRLKRQHWEWEENRMATTIETVWGAQRNTPATTDCWHMNTRIRAG